MHGLLQARRRLTPVLETFFAKEALWKEVENPLHLIHPTVYYNASLPTVTTLSSIVLFQFNLN